MERLAHRLTIAYVIIMLLIHTALLAAWAIRDPETGMFQIPSIGLYYCPKYAHCAKY